MSGLQFHRCFIFYGFCFRHNFEFPPFQIFLFVFVYMALLYGHCFSFPLSKLAYVILFCHFWGICLLRVYVGYAGCYFFFESDYYCFSSFPCWLYWFLTSNHFRSFCYLDVSFLFLKLRAALRKPKEALFRYHFSFPWKILIDFSSFFLQSLSHNSIRLPQMSFS